MVPAVIIPVALGMEIIVSVAMEIVPISNAVPVARVVPVVMACVVPMVMAAMAVRDRRATVVTMAERRASAVVAIGPAAVVRIKRILSRSFSGREISHRRHDKS